jgi:methyltransferase (TIGR00027 family)
MREGQRSRTSDWVAALRALYSEAPSDLAVIDDPLASRLLPNGLGTLVRWTTGLPFGARLAHRALGALSLGLSYDVPLRSAAIDDVVRRAVVAGAGQLVLLGAGLDARAWRMPELEKVTVFELDHPTTCAYKRERVAELASLSERVCHVAIDFERQRIDDVLPRAGFDAHGPSCWIWEGVSMYLTRPAIEATLTQIARLSCPASTLVMTYIPPDYGSRALKAVAGRLARLLGEPVLGEIDAHDLRSAVELLGFQVESDDAAPEWARRYWPAREAERARVWERLLVAVRRGN